ncbi:hypothetical protein QR680_005440 [Steinernema hermaphroditum]|uniref:ABC-type uncharacterized transport system domain-containing protein n=1 Tax=Steinernema hermaphroditum TaxID=289476 RepID=A0AA39HTB2_9BILA|nr:hypothetical protein QR680_005440 [Steinernema hermaphroditum]
MVVDGLSRFPRGDSLANGDASNAPRAPTNRVVLNQSKHEQFGVHSGFRLLHKRLRQKWKVDVNNDEISDATFSECRLFVLPHPRAKFTEAEVSSLRAFLRSGGSVLALTSDGADAAADTNLTYFLEEYGISTNKDSVIRTVFYKYFDPKEALVTNGILNRAIAYAAGKTSKILDDDNNTQALCYLYPYGCTLNVDRNSTAVLSTGTVCYPTSRVTCAFHETPEKGRLAVVGSVHMFCDQYLEKEENVKVFDVIVKYLTENLDLNQIDAADPDLADPNPIPDLIYLSEQIKVCLQEGEMDHGVAGDFTKLFDASLHSIDLDMWPTTIHAYDALGLKHEPLTLIIPQFEVPLPSLEPAVFPPNFRELPPPKLEMFDLDDMFASPETQLAKLTNKCNEEDLDFYIRSVGQILGIDQAMPSSEYSAKNVLQHIVHEIIEFKKVNQEDDDVVDNQVELFDSHEDVIGHFSDIDDFDDDFN